jgi:hypothetical protein
MRFRIVVGLAVLGLAGLVSSVALGRHAHQLACSVSWGAVDGYHVTAKHCHTPVTVGAPIYRVDTLKTSPPSGTFDFHTPFLAQCHQGPGAIDVIAPTASIAIRHLAGTTWSRHLITSSKKWLTTTPPNNVITVSGSILGLSTSAKGSLVQIVEGTATISSPAIPTPIIVQQGSQLFLPTGRTPGSPSPLVLSPVDQVTVKELQLNVIAMGSSQAAEHLQSRGETSAVVVGDNGESAKREAALLPGIKVTILTADQVRRKPKVVTAQVAQLGAHSVITVGAYGSIEPAWEVMRTKSNLPEGTAVVYATP